jgi:hypothetical protein
MDIVAVGANAEVGSRAIDPIKSRRPVYLPLIAANLAPIFLAGLSMLSCQQRHYIESTWGGLVVFSSILIYSLAKVSARTLTVRSAATTRERAITTTRSNFDSLLRRPRWRNTATAAADNVAGGCAVLG